MTTENTFQAANVHVLEQTNSLLALHAKIRDKYCAHQDFVFYADQVIRLLLDKARTLLPFKPHNVTTPLGEQFQGMAVATKVCAVSVIRAGESMESELRSIELGLPMGKILIQRNKQTKQPKLYYANLPDDIAERHVFLLEPMLATGGSALEAVSVLKQANVKEENILFINLLASPQGLDRLITAHPKIQLVTSSIEKCLNEHAFMVPGIGDFGDRYFGTTDSGAK